MELQQAIEQSTRDYKIFWAWLNSVIMRLMDEPVPDDIAAFSQQDIIYLAEFLSNFDIFDEEGNLGCGFFWLTLSNKKRKSFLLSRW